MESHQTEPWTKRQDGSYWNEHANAVGYRAGTRNDGSGKGFPGTIAYNETGQAVYHGKPYPVATDRLYY